MTIASRMTQWRDPLPHGVRVDYLGSTGTQWIDTGIVPTVDTRIEAEISWSGTQGTEWAVFFGVTRADTPNDGILARQYSTARTNFNPWFCNADYAECQIANVTLDARHLIVLAKNTATLDGRSDTITTTGTPYQGSIYLFCGNNGGSAWRHSRMRLYSFRAYGAGGTPLRDMIPVRLGSDGFLYDRVSKGVFGNMGTGTFEIGINH